MVFREEKELVLILGGQMIWWTGEVGDKRLDGNSDVGSSLPRFRFLSRGSMAPRSVGELPCAEPKTAGGGWGIV